jgi:Fe-S cluster assembly scaffold protein SufB
MSQANIKSQFSSTASAELAEGSTLNWHAATLGGSGGTHTLTSNVKGVDAVSTVNWVFSVRNTEKQAVSVRNVFDARNGGGEITLKGIAEGNGKARCDGMIEITENGTGTNTYLTENVLMLDATAHVDAIPGLEIRTNDVKASHSATVSRITAEDLFYLQSRGIDGDTARTMFVDGFLADLLERIAEPAVRERFLALVGQSGI